jgi:cation transport ATPase
MLFYAVGDYLQGRAVHRSKRAIASLMDLRPESMPRRVEAGDKVLGGFGFFLPPLLVPGAALQEWAYRALVISCPCALVTSIPLGYFGGIGGTSRNKLLIKGANHIDAPSRVDTVVFDKTGIITEGVFSVEKVEARGGSRCRRQGRR